MASEYPYAHVASRINTLFERIARQGAPGKADQKWLTSAGLSSSNDRRLLNILRFIRFIDGSGAPTTFWKDYRGPNSRSVLSQAIREGYGTLYEPFPDAHLASNNELLQFIRADTGLGDEAASKVVSTFKTLAGLAEWNHGVTLEGPAKSDTASVDLTEPMTGKPSPQSYRNVGGITVNVNLQLSLPESTDPAVYDALFASLCKHVLSGEASSA